jgi:Transport and Golgi organisation 2
MCTVLLRYTPGARWPVLVAAVRDEFVERPWDPPATHWADGLVGGRDRVAGGTWLAVDPGVPALAAVLNGVRLPLPPDGARPSRGGLPLAALRGMVPGAGAQPAGYDGFHLLRATLAGVDVQSWDGRALREQRLTAGDHIIVNRGVDLLDDPVVTHFLPLLGKAQSPDPAGTKSTVDAWGDWVELAAGDGLDPTTPGALLVRRELAGHRYGSTSVTLVALAPGAVRYDFTGAPWQRDAWQPVLQTE